MSKMSVLTILYSENNGQLLIFLQLSGYFDSKHLCFIPPGGKVVKIQMLFTPTCTLEGLKTIDVLPKR